MSIGSRILSQHLALIPASSLPKQQAHTDLTKIPFSSRPMPTTKNRPPPHMVGEAPTPVLVVGKTSLSILTPGPANGGASLGCASTSVPNCAKITMGWYAFVTTGLMAYTIPTKGPLSYMVISPGSRGGDLTGFVSDHKSISRLTRSTATRCCCPGPST